uniref:BRWD/PHIP N-terminal domain-containing protein n=1 Tax=Megaselia scalaris TaxID=36166 RepID=T1GXQ5_MEGSC
MEVDKNSALVSELYFLIAKLLSTSPLQNTSTVLQKELEEKKILPKRLDWNGHEHDQHYKEL